MEEFDEKIQICGRPQQQVRKQEKPAATLKNFRRYLSYIVQLHIVHLCLVSATVTVS